MDFVVGLPKTLGKFHSIWVVVDRLANSTHFILVRVEYNVHQFFKVCVKEIVSVAPILNMQVCVIVQVLK